MCRATVLALSFVVACLAPVIAGAQTETVRYYHTDAIGSVRMITDEAGQVVARYDYWPFGIEVPPEPPTVPETRRFAGKERDTETQFDYFGGRYYQSLTGRFTTVDPVLDVKRAMLDPQQWNRYVYVRSNPFRYVDPDGRAIETLWDVVSLGMSLQAVRQDPTSVWNWVSLGADVVSVVGPGIPAIGMAIRSGGMVDGAITGAKGAFEFAARTAPNITFKTGHVTEHLKDLGLPAQKVEAAIAADVKTAIQAASQTGSFWGRVTVGGKVVEYRAFTLPDGTINVGTYYPPAP